MTEVAGNVVGARGGDPGYAPLDQRSVLEFAAPFVGQPREALEIGDGNLNLVFRVRGESGSSVIVKQALPYLRIVGDAWPLTLDRARIEAEALRWQNRLAPGATPELLHYDPVLAALVMEDLDGHEIWRVALNAGRWYEDAPPAVARFCARTLLGTSELVMRAEDRRRLAERFVNPELCAITDELVFTAPYVEVDSNDIEEHLVEVAARLRENERLRQRALELREEFRTSAEALIHGDLHTGSVMVADGDTRVIDPEFAFLGPMGFDPGAVLGNLALAHLAHRAQGRHEFAATIASGASAFWGALDDELAASWPFDETSRRRFVTRLLDQSARYAGVKMIRRIVGLAHVTDITSIRDDGKRYTAQVAALTGGGRLVLADPITSFEQLWELAVGAA